MVTRLWVANSFTVSVNPKQVLQSTVSYRTCITALYGSRLTFPMDSHALGGATPRSRRDVSGVQILACQPSSVNRTQYCWLVVHSVRNELNA
jgi:hypothetical protein